jgi:hypothetical protein
MNEAGNSRPTIECFEFYNLCQFYRHAPLMDQEKTCAAYKRLIDYIDATHLQEMKTLSEALTSARHAIEFAQRMNIAPVYSFELIDAALEQAKPFLERGNDNS